MAERLIVHIGAMKSGTSFIQNVLSENKSLLAERGILFPGVIWRKQVSAVQDLIDRGGPQQEPLDPHGPWRTMVREIDDWQGTAVLSMEFLSARFKHKVEQIRDTFPDTDVQIVLTVRDLARQLPAMWQESVHLEDHSHRNPGRWFWRHQEPAVIADRWVQVFGREHFTLITVPPSGAKPAVLWERFAQVGGLPTDLRLQVRSNPSLGVASAMVVRAVSERLASRDPLTRNQYLRHIKRNLSKEILARRSGEPRLVIHSRWVTQRAHQQVEELRAMNLRVIGDLEELLPHRTKGIKGRQVSTELQLEAALDAIEELIRQRADLEERLGIGPRTAGGQRTATHDPTRPAKRGATEESAATDDDADADEGGDPDEDREL